MLKNLGVVAFFAIIFFVWGVGVGVYHVFPYDVIVEIKHEIFDNDEKNPQFEILTHDIESLIQISDKNDLITKHISLIEYIWKNNSLPNHQNYSVDTNIVDERYDLSNLKNIDKITISMKHDVNSVAYLFIPENPNNRLIIYYQGHAGDFIHGRDTIQFFIENNYSVLAFTMPLIGLNNQPIIEDPDFGKIKLDLHEEFKFLESETFSSISYFVEPIVISLNYLDEAHGFESYDFVGISGGGWTAILYAAIDDRIDNTFSIAGSSPFYLRSIPENFGDYEQHLPDLYRITNYLELYVLASHGENRKLTQIFNKYDPCCFPGDVYLDYEPIISTKVSSLGPGSFEIFIDDTHNEHKISEHTLNFILKLL
ncbi:hypothetical protein AAA799E16_00142 [Marine Group I thaumarchaeote SCGC AAA799-E16]|uniref:Uncharacterized protein n=2 Tax=Marine Group I TaxID=905826 RepID=A0A087S238_9ARCH|nr:hypothetical protein AAA799E16_00142 [Marine Group I thaumarchaeote SCGC AAA799-E16]KFM19792.1 hypothetical protein SCCGRSA3_00322 [Marine Group I thaumarchaeote SCGC RSA3]